MADNIERLMNELRSLGGIQDTVSGTCNEDVDWYVRTTDAVKRIFEQGNEDDEDEEGEKDSAENESARGRAEVLSKRLEGVADFLEDGDKKNAAIALAKIVDDAKSLLDDISDDANAKKTDAKQSQKSKPKPRPGKETKKSEKGVEPDNVEFDKEKEKKESTIFIGGEVVEHVRGDPFGLGPGFLAEVVDLSKRQK